ncbi:hypothetical protein SI65_06154 [Aspergillus cristatus]|uniref:gamma-glutamylcyclotransferase n=1 Tax=Aspergillus cristatus TaxID=573508 RepID=A0A1E3BBD6_ASPCR|nr:hypothetical protein SI65_06154 [Aspergillus cristatus]
MTSDNTNPPEKITLTTTETTQDPKSIPLPPHDNAVHPLKPKQAPQPNPSTPLYFAYGSNLSPTQMRSRCAFHPSLSAKPVALARLDCWRWFICNRGYANVLPPEELRIVHGGERGSVGDGSDVPKSGEEDTVYGVLYEMARDDEGLLDGYEGVDWESEPAGKNGKVPVSVRPREQGDGEYNKWYLGARVTEWLDEEQKRLRGGKEEQVVLVYVDEMSLRVGPSKKEYVFRMDRAIREAQELGFPKKWADEVMRKFF